MNVLVTGGGGYIGSHTAKILKFNPVTYDNFSTGHREAVKWGPLVEGDLLDKNRIKEAFDIYNPVAVLHFAGQIIVPESVNDPLKYYQNNVQGTLNLLEIMLLKGVKIIIFSSSCAVYGTPSHLPIREDLEKRPITPYGKTKLVVEEILKDFEKAYGIKFAILRYFNASGADEDGEIGENHPIETHLIPLIIKTALGQREELLIYGDGTAIRDYIHVEDLALAHVKALDNILKTGESLELNLGMGRGFSVLEVVAAVERMIGKKIAVKFAPKREGDPIELIADPSRAKKMIGWESKRDLETILKSALRWHKSVT